MLSLSQALMCIHKKSRPDGAQESKRPDGRAKEADIYEVGLIESDREGDERAGRRLKSAGASG